jgi:predicted RNase H-like nuclease (RuvC/YqgF family)
MCEVTVGKIQRLIEVPEDDLNDLNEKVKRLEDENKRLQRELDQQLKRHEDYVRSQK